MTGTDGADIHPGVQPLPGEAIVEKYYPNSFRETELGEILQAEGVGRLVVCGMMSHMCIDATVRAAFDRGFQCIVAHDAAAARGLSFEGIDVGDRVHVQLISVDVDRGYIDFKKVGLSRH